MRTARYGFVAALLLAVFTLALAGALQAQSYPTKSILIVLPQQAGSATDVMVRLAGQKMSESMKQPVVMISHFATVFEADAETGPLAESA